MADLYIGKPTKGSKALIKILGPAIGLIKENAIVREKAIVIDGQTGNAVIYENCEKLFKKIGHAYSSWCEGLKNFNDLGGKDKSIRFRVTADGFIANTNAKARNNYASDILFKPLQFYIQQLQPLQEKYDEIHLLGKVLRAFRNMRYGESTQVTGRHPLEVSMYVWAAIYHDWVHAGKMFKKKEEEQKWFFDMFNEFFENENLSLVLYKCFRGPPTSNEQLLQMIEQECIDKRPYLDEKEEEAVPEKNEESMDNDKPETEHVCDEMCADLHFLNESTLSPTDIENESNFEVSMANDTTVTIDSKNALSSPQTTSSTSTENGPTINMSKSFISDLLISNDRTSTANSTITSSSQTNTPISVENIPESVRTSVKRELDDEEDCMIIDEPAAKKPKIEPINSETFSFDQPSAATLKEMCKKLNVKYCNDAYKFWGEIVFESILPASDNIKTHSIKSKNIFACFSQFFTGKTKSCFLFQHAINSALFDDLNASGIMPLKEIEKFCTSNIVFDEHVEFIAKFLSCKIGIYENGNLKKFGNWKNQNNADVLTLILSSENGLYSVVLDL